MSIELQGENVATITDLATFLRKKQQELAKLSRQIQSLTTAQESIIAELQGLLPTNEE